MSLYPTTGIFPAVPNGEKPVNETVPRLRRVGASLHPISFGVVDAITGWFGDVRDNWKYASNYISRKEYEEIMKERKRERLTPLKPRDRPKEAAVQKLEMYDGGLYPDSAGTLYDTGADPYRAGILLSRSKSHQILGENPTDKDLERYVNRVVEALGGKVVHADDAFFESKGLRAKDRNYRIAGINVGKYVVVNRVLKPLERAVTSLHEYSHLRREGKEGASTVAGAHRG